MTALSELIGMLDTRKEDKKAEELVDSKGGRILGKK